MNCHFDYKHFAKCPLELTLDKISYTLTHKYCDEEITFDENKKIKTLYIESNMGEIANKQLFNEVLKISENVELYSYYGCSFEGCNLPDRTTINVKSECVKYYDKLPRDKKYILNYIEDGYVEIASLLTNFNIERINTSFFRQYHIDAIGDKKVRVHAVFDNESIGLDYKNIRFSYISIYDENFNYTLLDKLQNNVSVTPLMTLTVSLGNVLRFIAFAKFIESLGGFLVPFLIIKETKNEVSNIIFSQLYDRRYLIESDSAYLNDKFKRRRWKKIQ